MLVITGSLGTALADRDEALVDAVAGAFTPTQMSSLIASATGAVDSRLDQAGQSLAQLQQLLGVGSDVLLALLRVLDRPDIQPEHSAQALAQAAIQYHSATDQLAAIVSEDPDGQRLVTEAQAAMIAGHFSETEALLRQLEDHEVAFSDEIALAHLSPNSTGERASSIVQHLIRAAQARTLLGEIALMKLRYGEATECFQAAQQRLASLPLAGANLAETQPDDTQSHQSSPPSQSAVRGGEGVTVDGPRLVQSQLLAANTGPASSDGTLVVAVTRPPAPQRDLEPPDRPISAESARGIPLVQSVASEQQSPPAPTSAVIARDQLAAVATAAPRGSTEQPTVSPSVAVASKVPPASPLSDDLLSLLLSRGDALLALGDVSSARLLYQRAAGAGDGRAATGVGKTFDPLFLSAIGAHGIKADPSTAATWYRRAIGFGDEAAAERLKRLSQGSER